MSRFKSRDSVAGSSSVLQRSSYFSGSGTRQTNSSIDEVSVLEARIGDFMRLFHIGKQPPWFVIINLFALSIFVLQVTTTVFPAAPTAVGDKYFWDSEMATALFVITWPRTLMSYNIPMSWQYWLAIAIGIIEIVGLIVLALTFRAFQKGNVKLSSKLRVLVYVFLYLNFLFLMPLAFSNTGWSNCQWSLFGESTNPPVLKRTMFDKEPLLCWEFTNSFTGFMALISITVVSYCSFF